MRRDQIPVVILCGGEGTRFHEETQYRPKPLAEIGGRPILFHIMRIYAAHGFKRFVLCLGYKGAMIKEYFLDYDGRTRDFRLKLGTGEITFIDGQQREDWDITFVDTGPKTMTGARIKKIEHLVDADDFMVTYGDGVADVDIGKLLDFHLSHGEVGTVTGVQSNSQFGQLVTEDDRVTGFAEKPKIPSVINGGFFVFKRRFFDYLSSDEDCILERDPLTRLTQDGRLRLFLHDGFWQCMDTLKDYRYLNDLWGTGEAPWLVPGTAR